MINFINLCKEKPYQIFRDIYEESLKKNQPNIDAICISSFDKKINEVQLRKS